jgi:hypothetical protein
MLKAKTMQDQAKDCNYRKKKMADFWDIVPCSLLEVD